MEPTDRARDDRGLALASYAQEGSDYHPSSSSGSHNPMGNSNSNNNSNNLGNISNMGISSDDQLVNNISLNQLTMSRNRSFEIKDKDKETT